MKIAVISFSNPFVNLNDGGKMDILSRIKCLKDMGITIDHFSVLKKNEKQISSNIINKNYVVKVKNKMRYLFSIMPISVNNRYDPKLSKELKKEAYDYYILENFNMIKYIKDIPKGAKIALRVHNIESLSRMQLFKSNYFSIKSILELLESIKYRRVERQSLKLVDKFLFISNDEKAYFKNKYNQYADKYYWVPPICESIECKSVKLNKPYILYYGDLTVSHNIIGMEKFLKNVYKNLYKDRKIKLKAAGRINEKDKNILEKYEGVEIQGYIKDLDSLIQSAAFIVAPIYTGAGVKIKVVYAIAKGKIVITTPKGIEGTGLEKDINALSAESYNEYYNYCIRALDKDTEILRITENGFNFIKEYYSRKYNMRKMKEILGDSLIEDRAGEYELEKF